MQSNNEPDRGGRLETRHIWTAWAAVNLAAVAVAVAFAINSHGQVEQRARDVGDNLLQSVEQPILAKIEHARAGQDLMALALQERSAAGGPDLHAAEALLARLQALRLDPLSPRASDAEGNLIVGETERSGGDKVNYARRDYFKALAADPSLPYFIGAPVFSMKLKTPAVVSASPYKDKDGKFAGIAFETIALSTFEKILSAPVLQDDDSIVLRDARDLSSLAVRRHVDPSLRKTENDSAGPIGGAEWTPQKGAPTALKAALARGESSGRFAPPRAEILGGHSQAVVFKTLPGTPWVLIVSIGLKSQFAAWRELGALLSFFCLSFMALSAWGARALARYESRSGDAERARDALNASLETQVADRTADLAEAVERVRRGRGELEEAERLASLGKMVAEVAHELNTPIGNAFLCSTSMAEDARALEASLAPAGQPLKRSALSAGLSKIRRQAEVQNNSLAQAATLVQAFKQVAVDRTSERRRSFDLRETLENVATSFKPAFARSETEISVEIDAAPGIECDTFPGALVQIASNMMQNALAHAFEGRARGSILVRAWLADGAGSAPARVHVEFRDDGVGLPAGREGSVFDPYFTTKASSGGSGIGLPLSRKLAASALSGSLTARSAPNGGATFLLSFPARLP